MKWVTISWKYSIRVLSYVQEVLNNLILYVQEVVTTSWTYRIESYRKTGYQICWISSLCSMPNTEYPNQKINSNNLNAKKGKVKTSYNKEIRI